MRRRTLRATISWSYSLLDPVEQRLLRRLSVFHEGWTLDETIRAFSAEQLHAGGEVDEVRSAHAGFFLDFARGVDEGIRGRGQLDAMRRARTENANVTAALQWLTVGARAGDPQ